MQPCRIDLLQKRHIKKVVDIDAAAYTYFDPDFEIQTVHPDAWTESGLGDWMDTSNWSGWICYDEDNEPVGYLVYELKRSYYLLTALVVHPTYRRRGYGSAMLLKLYDKLKKSELRSNVVVYIRETDLASCNFFKKAAFRSKLVPGYYTDGMDAVRFDLVPVTNAQKTQKTQ